MNACVNYVPVEHKSAACGKDRHAERGSSVATQRLLETPVFEVIQG